MKPLSFEMLETERLRLRKFTPAEYIYLFENYTPEEIKKELGLVSDEEYLEERKKYEGGYSTYRTSFVLFQMIEKTGGEIIGGCALHNWYAQHSRAELGYALTKAEFKRKGLMSEAAARILDYGFNTMQLNRIEAFVGPDNEASLKLLARFGFQKEGCLRRHYFKDGHLQDSVVFSLLKEEHKQL